MIMVNHVDDRDDHNREGVDDQETNGIQFEDGGGTGSQKRGCVTIFALCLHFVVFSSILCFMCQLDNSKLGSTQQ